MKKYMVSTNIFQKTNNANVENVYSYKIQTKKSIIIIQLKKRGECKICKYVLLTEYKFGKNYPKEEHTKKHIKT